MSLSRYTSLTVSLFLLGLLIACTDAKNNSLEIAAEEGATYKLGTGGRNSESRQESPYLVLVSIDGFRWDFLDLYPAPAIERLAASGIRAQALVPVFPTLTFPNHYSIATGLYPAHHGIVGNNFPGMDEDDWYAYKDRGAVQDGRWYKGEPIWVAAERHGLVSAAFFFVGTEAPVSGISPSHWFDFDQDVPGAQRVDQVLEWLSQSPEVRPHMITLYFEEVDQASHRFGPGSPESIAAIANVDGHIDRLVRGIGNLAIADEVSIVLVSDHGLASYKEKAEPLILDEVVDLEGFAVVDGGSAAFLFAREADRARLVEVRDAINESWQHGRAWLREEAPESFHVTGNSRFPEIIVLADPHYGVIATSERHYIMTAGDHGWSPEFPDMHGIFIAAGPRLPQGAVIEAISAVDVYPLMREILELPQIEVDGDASVLLPLLENR
ncbi:MAG: ectonucleotide pyrophosphatase/phosphodiesterase [Woeseia sp.]